MPDVSRSNSQRSDTSRPRVSFNRDVHVKRISTPGAPRVVGALASDGEGHLVPLPVRRERPNRLTRRELAKEAERVLAQADSINCTSRSLLDQNQKGNKHALNSNKKFSTLPPLRRKNKKNQLITSIGEDSPSSSPDRHINNVGAESPQSSLDRKSNKRNIVASVFSTLERSKKNKHIHEQDNSENLKKSKKNSSSLNDLLDNSSFPERSKKQRVELKRSVSDAGSRKNNIKIKKSSGFLSLDRLTSKRNKNKNKTPVIHSDYSDKSPARPRKNILKKSHSDSESLPQEQNQGEGRNKKQLSPIIEVHPREDYFHDQDVSSSDKMIHSSQLPAQRPTLTRGQTVDAMVKRLSHDFSRSRGPPRVVNSAPGLITPEHRQHNNNLPFSYTKPTAHQYGSGAPTGEPTHEIPPAGSTSAPTAVDGQVIYAEVVVSGGGSNGGAVSKQTVHTKVLPVSQEEPIQPKFHTRHLEQSHSKVFPSEQHKVTVKVTEPNPHCSDEDEGLGLTMEHGGYTMDYLDEGKNYNRKNNNYISKTGFVEKRIRTGEDERSSFHNTRVHQSKYESENYISDSSARGRADGMDSRRKDLLTSENYTIGRYDDVLFPSHINKVNQNHVGDYARKETYRSEFLSDARIIPPDEIDGPRHFARDPKDFLSRSVDSNDLSSRRDRLESRIESQRKERFISNKHSDTGRYKKDPFDVRNELNGKYTSDVSYNSRRDFLNSQLDFDRNTIIQEENDKNYGKKSSRFFESTRTEVDRSPIIQEENDKNYGKKSSRFFESTRMEVDRSPIIQEENDKNYGKKSSRFFESTRTEVDRSPIIQEENDKNYGKKSSRYFESTRTEVDRSPIIQEENDKNYGMKSSRYFESTRTEVDSYGKKDLLADSGIEIDYRTKDSLTKFDKPSNKVPSHNVTRVDLRSHSRDHVSDEDEVEIEKDTRNQNNQYHKTKTTSTFTSTRLVQEQKNSETIPSSTVLIRHWVPNSKEESSSSPSKNKKTQTKPEKIQQPLLSDEEYEEYEKSRRKEEHKKEVIEENKKSEEKIKKSEEKTKKNADKKEAKKKPVSAMDKMRQLFSRNENKSGKKNKRKEEKVKVIQEEDEEADPVTARYTEYKGSNIDLSQESPRPTYKERIHVRDEEETPKPVLKNKKLLEPGSPRERRHGQGSNMELNRSPRPSHRSRSRDNLDEGTPRLSHREGSRKQYHRIPDIDEHRESEEFQRPMRERLATPSPSPSPPRTHNRSTSATLTRINNMKNKENNSNGSGGGWFKSLDRLTKKSKSKTKENDTDVTTEDEMRTIKHHNNNSSSSNKNLRFFGDTDQESVSSVLRQPLRRYKPNNNNNSTTSSSNRLQVPSRNSGGGGGGPRHHRSTGDVATSSAESTTEGDSSQQSQRSVVYLHAATVGDIPGPPRSQHSGVARRAQSREELSSTAGSSRPLQPQTRTVSRSISVLAPWKPRHYREGLEVRYDNNEGSGSKTLGRNKDGKPPKVPVNSTMNRNGGGNRYRNNVEQGNSTHKQRVNKAMSVESLSRKNGGQYTRERTDKKHSTSIESLNHRQNRDKSTSSKKYSALNSSAVELNSNTSYRTATKKGNEASTKKSSAKVSRSASMPKDSRLTAGWFKLRNKKQGT